MGNVDLVAVIKYLWAVLPPILWKAWGIIDARFKQVEDNNKEIKEDISDLKAEMKSSIDVLVERSANQEKRQDDMSAKLDKIYEMLMKKGG